jgi:hypothetical protein
MVTVPLLLSEISSKRYNRSFGTLHQISIGIGMITAQSLSIPFAKPFTWRYVLAVGFSIPAVLFALSGIVSAEPQAASQEGQEEEQEGDEETPLVRKEQEKKLSVKDLWYADSDVKRGRK